MFDEAWQMDFHICTAKKNLKYYSTKCNCSTYSVRAKFLPEYCLYSHQYSCLFASLLLLTSWLNHFYETRRKRSYAHIKLWILGEEECDCSCLSLCQKGAPHNRCCHSVTAHVVFDPGVLQVHLSCALSVPGCWYFCCKDQHRGSESYWRSHSRYWEERRSHHYQFLWSYKSR